MAYELFYTKLEKIQNKKWGNYEKNLFMKYIILGTSV